MLIIITGEIGIGKTTVCHKLTEIIRSQGYTCGGILSYKASDESIVIADIQSGEKETLASTNRVYPRLHTAKYFFNPEGIDFGIRAIDKSTSAALLVVDEIGHLELRGEGFVCVLELIKARRIENCILVIRKELLTAFLPQFSIPPLVFEVTESSRNQLPHKIGSMLLNRFAGKEY